jgi:hypothetical protein
VETTANETEVSVTTETTSWLWRMAKPSRRRAQIILLAVARSGLHVFATRLNVDTRRE